MTETQEYLKWDTDRGKLKFVFEVTYTDPDCLPTIKARITWCSCQADSFEVCVAPPLAQINLKHCFGDGAVIEGFLQWIFISRSGSRGVGAIWGDFRYGPCRVQHFEGTMVTFAVPPSAEIPKGPESPAEHDDKIDEPCDDPCHDPCDDPRDGPCEPDPCTPAGPGQIKAEDIDHDTCDLFPYVYLRRWPRLSEAELILNFVRYKKPADITSNLYATLRELRSGSEPGLRTRMEKTAVDFAEGDPPWQGQLITGRNPLTGPIAYFSELYRVLQCLCGPTREKVLAEAERVLDMKLDQLTEYLKSNEYLAERDRVWQNFFALVIILGYRAKLLEETIEILIFCHLLETVVKPDEKHISEPGLERLINATIILPPEIYPLPPHTASPPAESPPHLQAHGWIEPYAIGDLQMVRQKLIRYQPGEIAYIVNVLPGERKEIGKRTLQKTTESQRDETDREQVYENEDQENRENLLSETAKNIAEKMVTTTYSNFDTTYGAPTTATLNGSWNIKTEPTADTPSKNDINRFAREVLNKTAARIASHTRRIRTFVRQNELEQNETSIFDNTGNSTGICGIYRWLNKVYQAWVTRYGNRLMVEFLIPNPAENYLRLVAERDGLSQAQQPVNPRALGISSFKDITRENYAALAARYEVTDIEPPPPLNRTVTAFLQSEEEKSIVIPDGYMAIKAHVAGTFPEGESNQITGLVGSNVFGFTGASGQTLEMKGEDVTVPVALIGNGVPASPPVVPNNNLATVSISCRIAKTTMDRWRIRTFNAILNGFKAQNTEFNQAAENATGTGKRQSPEVSRTIERRTLKQRCVDLLLDRYYQLVGRPYRPLVDPTPFNVGEPRYLQFFEHIFEWPEMTYTFSTDFKTDSDVSQLNAEQVNQESDELFGSFLRADFARVMVPVRNNQELIALFYLSSGMIWCDEERLTPVHQADVALANELKNLGGCDHHHHCHDESWEVVIPTSMCILQNNPDLSCGNKPADCALEETC